MAKGIAVGGLVGIFLSGCLSFINLGGIDSGDHPYSIILIAILFFFGIAVYGIGIYILRSEGFIPKRGYTLLTVLCATLVIWVITVWSGVTEPGSTNANEWYALPFTAWSLLSIFLVPLWALVESFRIYRTHV
jgi:hypothetical protein